MSSTTLARTVRQPLTWLLIAAVVLLSLLALESAGTGHAPSIVPLQNVSQDNGNGGGNPDKHCNDGKGQDNPQNKHCRVISGG